MTTYPIPVTIDDFGNEVHRCHYCNQLLIADSEEIDVTVRSGEHEGDIRAYYTHSLDTHMLFRTGCVKLLGTPVWPKFNRARPSTRHPEACKDFFMIVVASLERAYLHLDAPQNSLISAPLRSRQQQRASHAYKVLADTVKNKLITGQIKNNIELIDSGLYAIAAAANADLVFTRCPVPSPHLGLVNYLMTPASIAVVDKWMTASNFPNLD